MSVWPKADSLFDPVPVPPSMAFVGVIRPCMRVRYLLLSQLLIYSSQCARRLSRHCLGKPGSLKLGIFAPAYKKDVL
jgi:hypothetical protein